MRRPPVSTLPIGTISLNDSWLSRAAGGGFMKDARYLPHPKARTAGSNSLHLPVEGKDDLACPLKPEAGKPVSSILIYR